MVSMTRLPSSPYLQQAKTKIPPSTSLCMYVAKGVRVLAKTGSRIQVSFHIVPDSQPSLGRLQTYKLSKTTTKRSMICGTVIRLSAGFNFFGDCALPMPDRTASPKILGSGFSVFWCKSSRNSSCCCSLHIVYACIASAPSNEHNRWSQARTVLNATPPLASAPSGAFG